MTTLSCQTFADRTHAGRQLAHRLQREQWSDPVVLGLARGGVPVAAEVARKLEAPMDVTCRGRSERPAIPSAGSVP
jgi:putative phosphoribosyl transferase